MSQPDLSEQVAHLLQSLERATPEALALAESATKLDAVHYMVTYAILIATALLAVRWCVRFIRRAHRAQKEECEKAHGHRCPFDYATPESLVAAYVAAFFCAGLALLWTVLLPAEIVQYENARWIAVTELLARVHP